MLKNVVIKELRLRLTVPPYRVRLHREVDDGGPPVPLDSLYNLPEQGVGEGTRVVAEVLRALVESFLQDQALRPPPLHSSPLRSPSSPLVPPFSPPVPLHGSLNSPALRVSQRWQVPTHHKNGIRSLRPRK